MLRWLIAAALVLAMLAGGVAWYQQPTFRQARLNQRLVAAVEAHNSSAVTVLLTDGADPNARDHWGQTLTLWQRLRYPSYARERDLYRAENWQPVLRTATQEDDAPIARMLLDKGANVNERDVLGSGALSAAAYSNDVDLVGLLLQRGADRGCQDEALLTAAFWGNTAVARVLIAHGANVNARIFSWGSSSTPLMNASGMKRQATVKLLLRKGADVNFRDEFGYTPLKSAMGNRRPDLYIIQTLKQAGAHQ